MAGPDGTGPMFSGWELWYIVPVTFIVVVLAVGGIAVSTLSGTETPHAAAAAAALAKLPPYWTVEQGQTYSDISERTGLSVDQLEAFNPRTNPATIRPGQRIKLRENVPAQAPKPLGPKFWTVRHGQSFGSIAAATGKPIDRLIALNKRLKPEELKPGDRVRLRR
jgi:LysM repeat protein